MGRWDPSNKYTNYVADDTSEDMRVIHNSYFSNTFNGIGEAIGLIGFGSCEEVDELEELAPGIIVNPNHSLFEKDQVYKNKYVLTSALKRHSILKHFQFKTTRSSSIRRHFRVFTLGKSMKIYCLYNKSASEKLRRQINMCIRYLMVLHNSAVCLHQRICTCGRFQLDELPCHTCFGRFNNKSTPVMRNIARLLYKKNLFTTYQFQMDPLRDESTWNTPTHVLEEV
ncbi:hypothetical protein H5410_018033, partial [Solanum commersonii]